MRVADARNRVAHGGRRATYEEGENALYAGRAFYEHLLNLANEPQALSRFPALAPLLLAQDVHSARPQNVAALQECIETNADPLRSFHHFKALANRERAAGHAPIIPSIDHAELWISIDSSTDTTGWWAYDPDCHFVARAEPPNINEGQLAQIRSEKRPLIRAGLSSDTFQFRSDYQPRLAEPGTWIDALNALPDLCIVRPT